MAELLIEINPVDISLTWRDQTTGNIIGKVFYTDRLEKLLKRAYTAYRTNSDIESILIVYPKPKVKTQHYNRGKHLVSR